MYRLFAMAAAVLLLAAAGCKQPSPVELKPPDEGNIVVSPVPPSSDSTKLPMPVDSSALLPDDEEEYAGIILLNSVKYDSGGIRYGAYSWVYFADRQRALRSLGETVGFYGVHLSSITLNGAAMNVQPHIITGPLGIPRAFGWEYRLDLTSQYHPEMIYRWQASADSIGAIDVSISSPDSIQVLAPKSGSTVLRSDDLMLQWIGNGKLTIILNEVGLYGTIRPVARVNVYKNVGRLLLPSSYLQLLRGRGMWLTFVLSNRNSAVSVAGYDDPVLVQAASVYNTYVGLR